MGTIQKKIVLYNLDVSHFLGHAHNRGKTFVEFPVAKAVVKKRTIAARGHRCESCKNTHWMGKLITLELEHIDGNNTNHVDSNLLLLCPNCHSQTPTWRRRKENFAENPNLICPDCSGPKQSKSSFCKSCAPKYRKRIQTNGKKKEHPKCACGKIIASRSIRCSECLHKGQERIVWPEPDALVRMLAGTSFTALGRDLGVSDNAIRKYLRKHGYDTKTLLKV